MLTKDGLSALLLPFVDDRVDTEKPDCLSTVRGKKAWHAGADAKTVKSAAWENLMVVQT